MVSQKISRRKAVSTLALGGAAAILPHDTGTLRIPDRGSNTGGKAFRFCLNTSTISGKNPGLLKYIQVASQAGFDGIEVWISDVQAYLAEGHTTGSLRGLIEEHGLRVENAIGFAPWLAGGREGFIQMEEEMHMLSEIGCRRIAAPPAGLPGDQPLDLFRAGERYRELLELGRRTGVMPQLEFWGASPVLWHLGQVLMIVAVADDPDARILPDVYHLFRGGSGFGSLKILDGSLIEIFHVNDYPGSIPREQLTDADRIYPGDGVAPMQQILATLDGMGGEKVLSLELFNRAYWEQELLKVARTGLQKITYLVSALP